METAEQRERVEVSKSVASATCCTSKCFCFGQADARAHLAALQEERKERENNREMVGRANACRWFRTFFTIPGQET